jgi:hypothetical protein
VKESLRPANYKWHILFEYLKLHIWLSLVELKLEAGTKIGKLLVTNQVLAI